MILQNLAEFLRMLLRSAALSLACAIVLFASGQANAQGDQEQTGEPEDTVTTRHAVYKIRWNSEGPSCVYRNDVKFYCPPERTELGELIKTKDYDLIPVIDSWSGTGNRYRDHKLIIEKGNK